MNLDLSKNKFYVILFLVMGILLVSCNGQEQTETKGKPRILVSTLMIAEGVQFMVGDLAEVSSLMGSGVDPHLFRPTAGDLEKMRSADIIILNGLHLEGRLGEITEALKREKTILFVSDYIPQEKILYADNSMQSPDPHVWMDPLLWADAMALLSREIASELNKDSSITARGNSYADSLRVLHQKIQDGLASVPVSKRVLVTSHDAFQYFGRAYGWEVKGLQGISTASDIGIREVSEMVNFLCTRKIPAVFPEASVSERNLEAVLRGCAGKGHSIRIGPVLYTDAPGSEGTAEGTYSGMLLHNQESLKQLLQ